MKKIDIYGEPVEILINKKHFIKTTIGGFLTILTIFLVLTFTWFIGKDIIYKENPISYTQNNIFEKYFNFNITNNNFPFSFALTDDNNIPLFDDSYLKIKLYYYTYGINETNVKYQLFSKSEIPLKACEYSDFPNITHKEFEYAQLSFTFCPKDFNFNLKGYWNEEILSFLQISIERCKNTTILIENISAEKNLTNLNINQILICKSNEQIGNYISSTTANLNIYYIDTKVMINNNNKPIEHMTKASYKYLIPEYSKKTIFQIQHHSVNTDDGFIFESTNEQMFFKMVEDFTDLSMISNELEQFIVFEIYSSNNQQIYFRRYVKVSDILASMGGMLKVFSILFFYLNIIFSQVQKYVSIINEVFILNRKKIKQLENCVYFEAAVARRNFNLQGENMKYNCSSIRKVNKNEEDVNIHYNNFRNLNNKNHCEIKYAKEIKNEYLVNEFQLNSSENNNSKNLLLLNNNNHNNIDQNKFINNNEQEKSNIVEECNAPEIIFQINEIEKNKLIIKSRTHKPHSQSNSHSNSVKSSTIKKKIPKFSTFKSIENIEFLNIKSNKKTNNEKENQNKKSEISKFNRENNNNNLKPTNEIQSHLNKEANSKLNNEINKYPDIHKFLNLRNNNERIDFSLKNIFKIICISHCKRKIPEAIKENYLFFKKGKESVNNYFDLVYMIKKFEEIKIMKYCILNIHQLRMLELFNKPILTINSNDVVEKNIFNKNKKWIKISNESNDYGLQVDEFLKNADCSNNIDMNIISLIHHYENI